MACYLYTIHICYNLTSFRTIITFAFDVYFAVMAFSNHFLCLNVTRTIDSCCLVVVIIIVYYLKASTVVIVDSF